MLGLQDLAIDRNGVGAGEAAAPADHLDAAPVHQIRERTRDAGYHRLLAIDQRRPVEARFAD